MTEGIGVIEAEHIAKGRQHVIHTHYSAYLLRLILRLFLPDYERHFSVDVIIEIVNRYIAGVTLLENCLSKWVIVVVILILLFLDLCVMVAVDYYYSVIEQTLVVKVI